MLHWRGDVAREQRGRTAPAGASASGGEWQQGLSQLKLCMPLNATSHGRRSEGPQLGFPSLWVLTGPTERQHGGEEIQDRGVAQGAGAREVLSFPQEQVPGPLHHKCLLTLVPEAPKATR